MSIPDFVWHTLVCPTLIMNRSLWPINWPLTYITKNTCLKHISCTVWLGLKKYGIWRNQKKTVGHISKVSHREQYIDLFITLQTKILLWDISPSLNKSAYILYPMVDLLVALQYFALTLSVLGEKFTNDILKYFSYFSQKTGFDFSCTLSPQETMCMKCQSLFSGKNKKKYHQFVVCWISPESGKCWSVTVI